LCHGVVGLEWLDIYFIPTPLQVIGHASSFSSCLITRMPNIDLKKSSVRCNWWGCEGVVDAMWRDRDKRKRGQVIMRTHVRTADHIMGSPSRGLRSGCGEPAGRGCRCTHYRSKNKELEHRVGSHFFEWFGGSAFKNGLLFNFSF